jgi:VCBS repeat-containing protein
MKFRSALPFLLLAAVLALSTCSSSSGTYVLGIAASAGAISQTGSDWTFDAGIVPQFTTEDVTFTVKNTGSDAFTAQGATNFSSGDFTTNLSGSFTVEASASNSFVGSFAPTGLSGQETGTLTLTPTTGNPIVINLKGTPDRAFQVINNSNASQITNISAPPSFGCGGLSLTMQVIGSSIITLTGNPTVAVAGSSDSISSLPAQFQTITSTTPLTFQISNGGSSSTGTVTITGTDSANSNGNFTFSFSFDDTGCS